MKLAFLCLTFLAVAFAQPAQVRFTIGSTSFADTGNAAHFTLGGSARFYLSDRWSIEPEYLYMRGTRQHHDSLLWANFAYDFRDHGGKVVPYAFGAPGIVHSVSQFGGRSFSNTEGALGFGAGVRIKVTDRVFVAPQFRMGVADSFFGEVTGSIGYVFR